ncbi:MAG: amidohydrolase family protein [SAR202 cluster bacterium]|nr:amidohydrolase family protein [SAR202 cluster bacterium]
MYDLLIKNGTVIDPSQNLHKKLDLAVSDGVIAATAPSIPKAQAAQVIDASGKIVAPGLIDLHVHIYHPGRNRNHPDIAGVRSGVVTMVDAGGPGSANFKDFCEFVLPQAETKTYSFLSIFRDRSNRVPPKEEEMDIEGTVKIAQENPWLVKGIKVIVAPRTVQALGLKHVVASKKAAREAGIKLMMHVGDIGPRNQTPTPPEIVAEALDMLDPGDMVTHIFTPLTGAALDRYGHVLPQLLDAQERGVFVDTAFGDFNFGWLRADTVLAQGVRPDTIATDIEIHAGDGMRRLSDRGLLEYASYFFSLGFSIDDIIRMTTAAPARYLGIEDRAGSLAQGRPADVSIIDSVEGRWLMKDAAGSQRIGDKALVPVVTVRSGKVIKPGEAPHPWGWTPAAADASTVVSDN